MRSYPAGRYVIQLDESGSYSLIKDGEPVLSLPSDTEDSAESLAELLENPLFWSARETIRQAIAVEKSMPIPTWGQMVDHALAVISVAQKFDHFRSITLVLSDKTWVNPSFQIRVEREVNTGQFMTWLHFYSGDHQGQGIALSDDELRELKRIWDQGMLKAYPAATKSPSLNKWMVKGICFGPLSYAFDCGYTVPVAIRDFVEDYPFAYSLKHLPQCNFHLDTLRLENIETFNILNLLLILTGGKRQESLRLKRKDWTGKCYGDDTFTVISDLQTVEVHQVNRRRRTGSSTRLIDVMFPVPVINLIFSAGVMRTVEFEATLVLKTTEVEQLERFVLLLMSTVGNSYAHLQANLAQIDSHHRLVTRKVLVSNQIDVGESRQNRKI